MADWEFTTSDALTQQVWAKGWWIEAKTESYFYSKGFIGPDEENDIIVEFPDLSVNQGYRLTYGQIRNLSGAGVPGDNTMEGNEEVPDVYDDTIDINQKRNAVRTQGKLSDRYPSDKHLRKWAKRLLKRWMADTIDQDIFTALGSSLTKSIYGGDATSTATIEAGDYFQLSLLAKCAAYADKATPKIIGKKIDGDRHFACVISPDMSFDLTTRDSAWSQAQREAQARGKNNPIFTGAEGMSADTMIYKHSRVSISTTFGSGADLNGATGLFMGVGSGGIAYAKKKSWNEKSFDFGNKAGFCIGSIYGVSKSVFNSADNGVVGVSVYRTSN